MNIYQLRGGARIEIFNASYPLAKLIVTRNELKLNVLLLGKFVFKPEDVISIEPSIVIPFVGQGIKINHSVEEYKKKIIFWTFKNPEDVIQNIKNTGLLK